MSTKWKCPKCGRITDTDYKKCNCGQIVTDEEQKKYVLSDAEAISSANQLQPDAGNRSIVSRYTDAYLTSRTITRVGATVKFIAFFISVIIVLFSFIAGYTMGSQTAQYIFGGIILGFIVGIPFYVLGILVSSQGQILKATLDTAVNSSQLLTKDEMRKMMSVD